ncbi:hypothetical protein FM106_16190 [Brachybacterium faecium]|nr:hypothetical protein FM106_16190 [Brachybacterium faecium]
MTVAAGTAASARGLLAGAAGSRSRCSGPNGESMSRRVALMVKKP